MKLYQLEALIRYSRRELWANEVQSFWNLGNEVNIFGFLFTSLYFQD